MSNTLLTQIEQNHLLEVLKNRFDQHMHRHPSVDWSVVSSILLASAQKILSIYKMENTGGEPDVIILDHDHLAYCDCSRESPIGRRSLCYDKAAWDSRKENKPIGNVVDMTKEMGIELLNEEIYRKLQSIEEFDLKTSSWLLTPEAIRAKKGAIFGDRRYDHIFVYHNGAESYYAARGFRGIVRL
ncbi:DUF4256 domain-containing protein [Sphingobacterium rhinopitheci]|uniref:DUF4256 domain-containing protein n=1 Tax=Sphingobacterium rhinopitheci TaxID=2781960 RepID=UPI001F519FF6|nr:DUF4256 domain-containing protein [Sphingobacterium rhinopitheci]MCI0922127.1 DUF4256 domain-containing protein [Sphingobacterium rhinopitheci]